MYKKYVILAILPFSMSTNLIAQNKQWKTTNTIGECTARHEAAAMAVDASLYLLGGRGVKPVEQLDLNSLAWKQLPPTPIELNHFQALAIDESIYVVGAFTGNFPHEKPVENIYIFNTKDNKWHKGAAIPSNRLRGAAGATVHNGKIYLVGGITDGHFDGHVSWFDEYDPQTGIWTVLPDAPHTRDHFQAGIIGNKLYVAGGRKSSVRINKPLELTISEVDVYDFETGRWTTLETTSNIPTPRAGSTTIVKENKLWVIGGESPQLQAHDQVEVFDPATNKWITESKLNQGRHGTQAIVYQNRIYIVAGSARQGGGPELSSLEIYE